MDSTAFSSPRTDCFPAGLRVLVVDDDPTWLKILEKMLNKCSYQVTTCNLAREALNLLRERKDRYDIVISDVNMPDMDGFKLLEHVGLEMDLPVIMMSVDGETSRVMKGVQHGACDYLLKPIRMKELRNIWQHVFRKRIHEVKDIEGHENFDEIRILRSGSEQFDDGYLFSGDPVSGRKRKDAENKHDDRVCGDLSSMKKARVVWTIDLHQKFVKAVNQIGFEKVGPKKILDLMGVPWLTRENVASHLQKYRLYLSRLQKENETKSSFCRTKYTNISSKDSAGNVICLRNPVSQNATAMQHNIQASESYVNSGPKIQIHNNEPEISKGNAIGGLPKSRTDSQKVIFSDVVDPVKTNSSRISFSYPIRMLDSDVKSEPKVQLLQQSWNAQIPSIQFKKEHNPDFHSVPVFDHLMQAVQQAKVDEAGHELVKSMETSLQPSYRNSTCQGMQGVSKVASSTTLFSLQPGSHLTNCDATDPLPNFPWSTKNHTLEQNLFDEVKSSSKRNMVAGTGSAHKLWDEGFNEYSCLGGFYPPDAYVGNLEMFGYNNQEIITDVPPCLYDSLKFDIEHPSDLVEYAVMDQGLFIA